MKKLIFLLVIAALVVMPSAAMAGGPGRSSIIRVPHDHPTIQEAIDAADTGDTILVGPGEYAGAIVTKAVKIRGSAGGTVINDGPSPWLGRGFKAGFLFLGAGEGSGATISHLTFKCGVVEDSSTAELLFPIFSRGADDVTVEYNTMYDAIQGITNWHGSGWTIQHNEIEGLQAFHGGGIGIFLGSWSGTPTTDNLVAHNRVTGAPEAEDVDGEPAYSTPGIALMSDRRWGADGGPIANNVVRHNRCVITSPSGVGIELTDQGLSTLTPPSADLVDNVVAFNDMRGSTFELALNPEEVADNNIISRNLGNDRRWDGTNPAPFLH